MPGQQGSSEQRGEDLFPCSQCVSWARHSAVMATSNDVGDYERMAELAEQRVKSGGLPSGPWPGRKGRSRGDSAVRLPLSARGKSKILLDLNAQKAGSGAPYHPSQWREKAAL